MDTISCKKRLISFFAPLIFSMPTFAANGHLYLGASIGDSSARLANSSPEIAYFSGALITDGPSDNQPCILTQCCRDKHPSLQLINWT